MNILLVEPAYKNKYPPIGLMKIATYHCQRGDEVLFTKGTNEIELKYDVIYITTLFTFYYDLTLETIKYYEEKYNCPIYVGGIMASILPDKLRNELKENTKLITGQLTSSNLLGYEDGINIDLLPLNYNILYQVDYVYGTEESYISYTTRGCTNKCSFCAVPKLEPYFMISNNLRNQVEVIQEEFGEKKDLLLLDNNILSLSIEELDGIVTQIESLGYVHGAKYIGPTEIEKLYDKYRYLKGYKRIYINKRRSVLREIVNFILKSEEKDRYKIKLTKHCNAIRGYNEDISSIERYLASRRVEREIKDIYREKDLRKGKLKFVDFNQGMDARQLSEEKMKILARIPINPFRLALDDVNTIPVYEKAIKLAVKYGVKNFSNYLLYNFKDTPEDMYERLELNVRLAEELNVNIYSFPMKFANIEATDRKNIGENWNRYMISNFRRILKPTMGVVGKGRSYFNRAFGSNCEDFLKILKMPYDFLTYRQEYEDNGLTQKWERMFNNLSKEQEQELLGELSSSNYDFDMEIMEYYKIRKNALTKM